VNDESYNELIINRLSNFRFEKLGYYGRTDGADLYGFFIFQKYEFSAKKKSV
jgi:hypothetical protein